MTATPLLLWLQIDAIDKEALTTVSLHFSNFDNIDPAYTRYNLLQNSFNLSMTMGEHLPNQTSGSLTLNNAPNSYGFERRISDLFQRYLITDKKLILKSAYSWPNDVTSATWTTELVAYVTQYEVDVSAGVVNISYTVTPFDDNYIGLPLTSGSTLVNATDGLPAYPSLPDDSEGVYLCEPTQTRIDADSTDWLDNDELWLEVPGVRLTTSGSWAFAAGKASNLTDETYSPTNEPITGNAETAGFLRWPFEGEYITIRRPLGTGAINSIHAGGVSQPLNRYEYSNFPVWDNRTNVTNTGYLIYRATVSFAGLSNPAWNISTDSEWIVKCYRTSTSNYPSVVVGEARVNKYDYLSSIRGGSNFDVDFYFTPILVIDRAGANYCFTISESLDTSLNGGLGDYTRVLHTYNAAQGYQRIGTREEGLTRWGIYETGGPIIQLYSPTHSFNEDELVYNSQRWNVGKLTLGFLSGAPTYEFKERVYIRPRGLTNSLIKHIADVTSDGCLGKGHRYLEYIDLVWDGSKWRRECIDPSIFNVPSNGWSDSTNKAKSQRGIGAAYISPTTKRTAFDDLCRQLACRLFPRFTASDLKLAIDWWSESRDPVAILLHEEGVDINSIVHGATDRLITDPIMLADEMATVKISELSKEALNTNFTAVYNKNEVLVRYPDLKSYIEQNITLFGNKLLSNPRYPFIRDTATATELLRALLLKFGEPSVFIYASMPHFARQHIQMGDYVGLVHPAIESFFGTSTETDPATYGGTITDPLLGRTLARAEYRLCQVEGKSISIGSDDAPRIDLVLRVIKSKELI